MRPVRCELGTWIVKDAGKSERTKNLYLDRGRVMNWDFAGAEPKEKIGCICPTSARYSSLLTSFQINGFICWPWVVIFFLVWLALYSLRRSRRRRLFHFSITAAPRDVPELWDKIPETLLAEKLEARLERRKDLQEMRLRNGPFGPSSFLRRSGQTDL